MFLFPEGGGTVPAPVQPGYGIRHGGGSPRRTSAGTRPTPFRSPRPADVPGRTDRVHRGPPGRRQFCGTCPATAAAHGDGCARETPEVTETRTRDEHCPPCPPLAPGDAPYVTDGGGDRRLRAADTSPQAHHPAGRGSAVPPTPAGGPPRGPRPAPRRTEGTVPRDTSTLTHVAVRNYKTPRKAACSGLPYRKRQLPHAVSRPDDARGVCCLPSSTGRGGRPLWWPPSSPPVEPPQGWTLRPAADAPAGPPPSTARWWWPSRTAATTTGRSPGIGRRHSVAPSCPPRDARGEARRGAGAPPGADASGRG